VARCLEYLLANGTYETDIFRICFNPDEETELYAKLCHPTKGVTVLLEKYSVSSVAMCIKKLLRDKEPLFPYKVYQTMIFIQDKTKGPAKILSLAAVVEQLPRDHRIILTLLFDLLVAVSLNQSSTQMDTVQLAYTFGPLLLNPKDIGTDMQAAVAEQKSVNMLMEDMLNNADQIFGFPEDEVVWQDEADISNCKNCDLEFSLLKRKKHCRVCGCIFCSNCTKHKVDGERACDACYVRHKGNK